MVVKVLFLLIGLELQVKALVGEGNEEGRYC